MTILFLFARLLDFATTALALGLGAREGNPIIVHYGWTPSLLGNCVYVLGFWALARRSDWRQFAALVLWLNLIPILWNLGNVMVLLHWQSWLVAF